MVDETLAFTGKKSNSRIWLTVFAVIAFIVLIVGIVLIVLAIKKEGDDSGHSNETSKGDNSGHSDETSFCEYSKEAKRIGLDDIISQVKKTYYEKLPFQLPGDPDATREDIVKKYSAYNPTPDYIKSVTDAAKTLFKNVNKIEVNSDKLKPRERKALSQLKHYLKTVFGHPFDMNYYAGDWMLGPTFYCSKQPICDVGEHLKGMLGRLKPENLEDLTLIEDKLKGHKKGILKYMENLKMGKLHGMVYSQEACVSGRDALKRKYLKIALKNETGVLEEEYVKDALKDEYYSDITDEMRNQWKKDHNGTTVNESLSDFLVEYMGKPMKQLLRYLEHEHYRYCVPSNVSSGLASLPLAHVWVDGKENTSWSTNTTLYTGHQLNGTETYAMILPYFTTNEMTPMDVHELGWKQLAMLYPQVSTTLLLFLGRTFRVASNECKEDMAYTGLQSTSDKLNLPGKGVENR